ncbi:acyltransferase-like protein [Arenicella xantha]|uniref:Acyltransferase-like protein n=1 Tax=Arenicella xantha TaxID=644221 RepID=A0A395JP36_9GAMM|nr:acyltransferase-like protein [Arenicella xantha]
MTAVDRKIVLLWAIARRANTNKLSNVKQRICHYILFKLLGWRIIGDPPVDEKYIFVAVPHTSNWDFVYGWLAIHALDLNVKIFAKDAFFIWPLNYLCRFLGVEPINRRKRTNFVDSMTERFEQADGLRLLITPEGTRGYQETLKSGYYYLAKKANVPIVVAGPCFQNKTFTILPPRPPLADFKTDQSQVIAFCKTQVGKNPEQTFREPRVDD